MNYEIAKKAGKRAVLDPNIVGLLRRRALQVSILVQYYSMIYNCIVSINIGRYSVCHVAEKFGGLGVKQVNHRIKFLQILLNHIFSPDPKCDVRLSLTGKLKCARIWYKTVQSNLPNSFSHTVICNGYYFSWIEPDLWKFDHVFF